MTDILAWSHSRVDDYKRCPKMMWHKSIRKDVPFVKTEQMKWGDRVHKALEYRVRDKVPLTGEFEQYEPIARAIDAAPGHVLCENKITLNPGLTPTGYFAEDAYVRVIVDVMKINGTVGFMGDYKGLALTEKLPTPTGWTTMGDVQVGDKLFARDGSVCSVIGKSRVKKLPCYRIKFDDTTEVTCDEEHLWVLDDEQVLATPDLEPTMCVPVCAPIALPDADLPLDPYVLGLWLADGKHTSAEITKPDDFIWEEIQRCGYEISHNYSAKAGDGKCRVHTVKGIRGTLSQLGVLGNKHIPQIYMRASAAQRLALLQGIMDGDGSANKTRKQVVLSGTNKGMMAQCLELILSLGQRATMADVSASGFGVVTRTYPIVFRPNGIVPFRLPRKVDACAGFGPGYSARRKIRSVERIESVPTQCIKVDSADHTFLCTERFLPTHNTGKIKFDEAQLKLFAAVGFQAYPEVQKWTTAYIWTKDKIIDPAVYTRDQLPQMWAELLQVPAEMQKSYVLNHWPAKPGRGCKWCGANKLGLCESAAERYAGD